MYPFFNIFDLLGYLLEKNKDLKITTLTLNEGRAYDCKRNPVFHIEKRGFIFVSTPITFHKDSYLPCYERNQ